MAHTPHWSVCQMASRDHHGHAYDLFVSYSNHDVDWVRPFYEDLVTDINRFADPDIYPFLDKTRLQPGYTWNEKLLAAVSNSGVLIPMCVSLPTAKRQLDVDGFQTMRLVSNSD